VITISGLRDAHSDHKKIADLEAKIGERDQERARAESLLNQPQNRSMRDRSQYLNELIARKAFSWTKAFMDLEKVMPPKVHVVSIAPELNEDNQLAIKMVVAGDSSERAIELARRMEGSQHFRETRIESQQTNPQGPGQGGDVVNTVINALYVPREEPAHEQRSKR
jgi:Tfp pilus assembly protein PilN